MFALLLLADQDYYRDTPPLVQMKTWCYHQGEEQINLTKTWCQEEHLPNENKQICHITRCHFDNWATSNTPSVR